MKTLALLIALVTLTAAAHAQEADLHEGALIESAEVQGIALERLSADLRRDIQALADQRLSRERVLALASRIETERPDVVAAARDVLRPDGRVRVIFLVAPIGDDRGLSANINARYTIERVKIEGIDDERISQHLRDQLQSLVGGRLDPNEAERLSRQIQDELPGYEVVRRISRGRAAGTIVVIFTVARVEPIYWIPSGPPRAKLIYHEDLGWSGVLSLLATGIGSNVFSAGIVPRDKDDLVEEYSGWWLRAESRSTGTKRLGMSLEFSKYRPEWNDATLAALPAVTNVAPLYQRRTTAHPTVTFAFNPHVRVSLGASVSTLDPMAGEGSTLHANTTVVTIGGDNVWRQKSGVRQSFGGSIEFRSGSTSLGSDLVYKRQFARLRYSLQHRHSLLGANFVAGRVTGDAPFFERFSLGDSTTLRGWNKYDLAPAGGNRMWHSSVQYSYRGFGYFLDAGSVGDHGTSGLSKVRLSTGVGFDQSAFFMTFGVPLNADRTHVTFIAGIRVLGLGFDKR